MLQGTWLVACTAFDTFISYFLWDTVDPAACIGTVVTGAINGKSDEGYYVSVVVGKEKLSGVLYHVSADSDNHQFAKIPSLLDGIGSEENTTGLEVQLYGKQRTETIKKRERNPNAPKRTRTGYNIYFKEQREKMRLLYPDMKGLGKKVIEMWGKLPDDEKSVSCEAVLKGILNVYCADLLLFKSGFLFWCSCIMHAVVKKGSNT